MVEGGQLRGGVERLGVGGFDDGNQADRRGGRGDERRPVDRVDAGYDADLRRQDRILERRQRESGILGRTHVAGQYSSAQRLARRMVRTAPCGRMTSLAVQLDAQRATAHTTTSLRLDCAASGLLGICLRRTGETSAWNRSRLRRFWATVTP